MPHRGNWTKTKGKYFPDGIVTESLTSSFKNRAQNDPLDEFVGIMYARPLTEFGGSQVVQHSYVDLNITSSRIIDTYGMPWSMFSYYNSGTAQFSDGHFRSRIYLNNNKYAYKNDAPISFLKTEDNGIIHSGFLLSEFPETTQVSSDANDKMRYEKYACQNVPVISRDNTEYGSYYSASEPRKNHRFLSNRTLENKYPYFQNVPTVGPLTNFTEAIDVSLEKESDENYIVENIYIDSGKYKTNNVFACFDKYAKFIDVWGTALTKVLEEKEEVEQPKICISFKEDLIPCKRGDLLHAALVTNHIVYNDVIRRIKDKETNEESEVRYKEPVVHSISFVELDSENTELGRYDYDVPYMIGSVNENEYDVTSFPSTSACGHFVKNKSTAKVKIVAKICAPLAYNLAEDLHFTLNAIFVEKNI